jgi:hypothetical protein
MLVPISSIEQIDKLMHNTVGPCTVFTTIAIGNELLPNILTRYLGCDIRVCIKSNKSKNIVKEWQDLPYGAKFYEIHLKSMYEINTLKEQQSKIFTQMQEYRSEIQ